MSHETPPDPAAAAAARPLCVDLDGTLVPVDTMLPLALSIIGQAWRFPFWLARGRPYFKMKLAEHSRMPIEKLPVHRPFLEWLAGERASGRPLHLVSASNERMVRRVADHFGIFSSAIGSDDKTNLRGEAKKRRLDELFGPKGYDYAGNSSVDYPVWQGADCAIVVNARPEVEKHARETANVVRVFPPPTGKLGLFLQCLKR